MKGGWQIVAEQCMNKQDIIKAVATETGLSKKDTELFLEGYIKVQHDCFMRGEKFKLVGHGTYMVKTRKPKRGVNPKCPDQKIDIPEKKTVVFACGKTLKEDLNQ